jgi:hypothetical protein
MTTPLLASEELASDWTNSLAVAALRDLLRVLTFASDAATIPVRLRGPTLKSLRPAME